MRSRMGEGLPAGADGRRLHGRRGSGPRFLGISRDYNENGEEGPRHRVVQTAALTRRPEPARTTDN